MIIRFSVPYCYLFSRELNFAKMENEHISRDFNFAIWPKIYIKRN